MTTRDQARRALESRDWGTATVDTRKRPATSVYSVRVDSELADWIAAEADRRGVKPSAIIRDAITQARTTTTEDHTVTVRLSDLHRAINTIVKPGRPRAA
ncbi:ribbon-helix-helix protein, CopG family [Stackebrandtia soli]|uniref:ribbon-helix-helix protein, CopG family n=1 Tax=Stackebrandtia soli TaxID=1892856 RepID=UPI0039ED21E5